MNIGIDLDGTLTVETEGHDYKNRTPNKIMINWVNKQYKKGNTITLFTSRYDEDIEVTMDWLMKYEVKFHKLIMGKPKFDLYIGDEVRRPKEVIL